MAFSGIAKEWHPTKNGNLKPTDVPPSGARKVWWTCKRGHEWQATINNRTHNGRGCPDCHSQTSRLEIRIFCELKAIFNDIKWREKISGVECDIYLPKYKLGIELDGGYWHLDKDKEENDRAKGVKLNKGGISLFRIRQNNLRRLTLTDIFYSRRERDGAVIDRFLRNLLGIVLFTHEDRTRILAYVESGKLQNNKEYKKIVSLLPSPATESSISHLYPSIAAEWNYEKNMPQTPTMFTPGSEKKVWWKCKEIGHEWEAQIFSRTRGSGCPYCSNQAVGEDNNLTVKFPAVAKEWHPTKNENLTPFNVTRGSNRKVWWKCGKGHEWKSQIASRTNGSGCPYCSNQAVGEDNNLAVRFPAVAKEWHPTKNGDLNPKNVIAGSGKRVWWKCGKGHEWEATIYKRTRGTGCPYCLKREGRNQLVRLSR